ncbi:hypothetical protein L2E82_40290 [Cichorium intybus]|uniref:Uncharacterized protein n=1 Tax=Cichorium intybus TaxID=13427 RepID=A0ACB9AK18_CICIN|nr:hypothetical protein L2E82_40290 [Cichorium intybus]
MHKDLVGSTVKRYNSYMNAKSDEGRMEFGQGKIGRNEEVDRLSSLADDVIHKILSFVDVRQAVKTSVLSSRWRFIWTSLPYLDFSLSYRNGYNKFVDNLLSRRDNQIHVSSVKLGSGSLDSIQRILNYTFSQNVKRLTFTYHLPLQLSTQGLPSLENMDLCFIFLIKKEAHVLVSLLEHLHTIRFLTLNLEILELDGSVFTMEIRVMRNIVSTQKLIAEFKKRWTKSALELQGDFEEMMVKKLSESCRVMSCLQDIKGLLTQLPASKRDVMQPTFSSVCEEAAIVTNNINMLDSVNIRYNKKPKLLHTRNTVKNAYIRSQVKAVRLLVSTRSSPETVERTPILETK